MLRYSLPSVFSSGVNYLSALKCEWIPRLVPFDAFWRVEMTRMFIHAIASLLLLAVIQDSFYALCIVSIVCSFLSIPLLWWIKAKKPMTMEETAASAAMTMVENDHDNL